MNGKLLNDNLCFILEKLAQNETLYKLLYPNSELFSEDLIHKNILAVPRIPADRKGSFIVVTPVRLTPSKDGFKELLMRIDIYCGLGDEEWITNGQLRCMLIMDEVIKEMKNVEISGIGKLELGNIVALETTNANYGGYSLGYYADAFEE